MRVADGTPGHVFLMMGGLGDSLRLSLRGSVYRLAGAQINCSACWALFEDGETIAPFAVVGLAKLPTDQVEAWFIVRPGGLAPHLLLALVRFARRQFEAAAMPVVSFVREGNVHGERLARMTGLDLGDERIGAFREWRRAWRMQ